MRHLPSAAAPDDGGQPQLRLELGDQARAPLLLDAERGPAAVLLWLPTSSAPKVFMSAAARTLPTPTSRSMSRRGEELPVELLELG